ncbi:sigma factor-like helix-turn-helix DNA-binding protein [Clostridium sp.]
MRERKLYNILYFFEGISVNDLSQKLKVSRQSINQTKLRALNKLKKEFL